MSTSVYISETATTVEVVTGSITQAIVDATVATHNALATAHGLTANISAALAAAASPGALNPIMTSSAIYGSTGTWTAGQTFQQPGAADWPIMTIDPVDADALPFYWKLWTSAQSSRDNVGWNFGYNQASSGGPQSATDATFYLQMETHYNPAADPLFEYHLNAYTANGGTSTRPFQINVYKDDLNTSIAESFDSLTWTGRSGTPQLMTALTGATAAASQCVMFMPIAIRYDGPDALRIQDADSNARVYFGENGSADGGYIKLYGANPTIDGEPTRYLNFQNFAGITLLPNTGVLYSAAGLWDGAPTINLTTGKVIQVNSVQVVGARVVDARIDDTINSGDSTTDGVIDAMRDALIAHGLMAAA